MQSFSAINEMLLIEDKVDWLKDQHKEPDSIPTAHDTTAEYHDAHAIIDHLAAHDPHPKKAYTPWMVNKYKKGDFRQEDAPAVGESLGNFDKYKGKLEKKDINQYKGRTDLNAALAPHLGSAASRKEEKKGVGALIHEAPGLKVYKVRNEEEATHFSKEATRATGVTGGFSGGTASWCTVAPNMFHSYTDKQGKDSNSDPLYVVHADHKEPTKTRYQFHFQSNQFANAHDHNVGLGAVLKEHPGLRQVKDFKDRHPMFEKPEDFNRKVAGGHAYNVGGQNGVGLDKEAGTLTPKTLEAAHKHWSSEVDGKEKESHLNSIAQHPNTPTHVLDAEAKASGKRHGTISENPNTTAETLDHIYQTTPGTGPKVAKHPNVSDKTKEAMLSDHGMHTHLLDNPGLSQEHISRIHGVSLSNPNKMQQSAVHEKIASHPTTHPDTLHDIAHGANHLAASNAIANPSLTAESHRSLYALGKAPIHAAQAKSVHTPVDVLGHLSNHALPFVRDTAKKTLARVK